MKWLPGCIACFVIANALRAAAESPTPFQYWKPLERETTTEEDVVAVMLDSDVYAATRAGLPDMRIFDDQQAEIPYHLEPDVEYRDELTRQPFDTEIVGLREVGDAMEVHLRLPEKSPSTDGFSLSTPQRNFERKLQVSGSADGQEWVPLVTDHIIFDYARFMDVSNLEVPLPPNQCREFKLTIDNVTDDMQSPYRELTRTYRDGQEDEFVERTTRVQRAFRVDRMKAWHNVTRQRIRTTKTDVHPVTDLETRQDAETKQTIVTVHARRQPISRFTLETSSRNFHRRVTVQVPRVQGIKTSWQEVGAAAVWNLNFRDARREHLTIEFPEHRAEAYQIVIHNEDNPPLEIQGVRAEGKVQRLVFLAEPARQYRLFYGSEMAELPKYEAATVLAALRRENFEPVAIRLGAENTNQDFGKSPIQPLRKLLNNWIFLGATMCLMVIALGWSLLRAGRHLNQLPPDDDAEPGSPAS